jgi:hypothetical protein
MRSVMLVILLAISPVALPEDSGGAPDLDTILARHVEARGGAERWAEVDSLSIQGTWEAFSTPGAFTAYRSVPDLWRFEHVLFGQPAVFGYDGEVAWIQGAALGVPQPARLDDAWRRNLIEDAAFRTPLLEGPSETLTIELVGRERVEGIDAWKLRVERSGFPEEHWYLDTKTYLEVKRESRTFDVFSGGIEIPMETFYDDFREVEGLVIPFHEERHFGTRYHVTDIESVEVGTKIDAKLFIAPPPPEPPSENAEEAEDAEPSG